MKRRTRSQTTRSRAQGHNGRENPGMKKKQFPVTLCDLPPSKQNQHLYYDACHASAPNMAKAFKMSHITSFSCILFPSFVSRHALEARRRLPNVQCAKIQIPGTSQLGRYQFDGSSTSSNKLWHPVSLNTLIRNLQAQKPCSLVSLRADASTQQSNETDRNLHTITKTKPCV
jgi:hypothetical protein